MESVDQRFAQSEAVFFDVDGVLVNNTMSVLAQSCRLALEIRDRLISSDEIMDIQLNNVTTEDILEALVQPTEEEWPRVRQAHRRLFHEYCMMPPIGNPRKFVQAVRASDRKTAIWTSRSADFLAPLTYDNFVFDEGSMETLFDAISTSQNKGDDKPHPDSLRALAKAVEVPCDKIVVVEDMPMNIRAIREAGMIAVGVTSGMLGMRKEAHRRLEDAGADIVLSSYEELYPYLGLRP